MEIIFEILSAIFGFLLEALWEIATQIVFEVLAEIGLASLVEPFRKPKPGSPLLAGIGYTIFGAAAGFLSLLLPQFFVAPLWLRALNLIVTPLICGFIMAKLGQIRERRGDKTLRIDTFFYGFLFALAMAVVRFICR